MAKEEPPRLELQGGAGLSKIKQSAADIWKKYQQKEAERQSINEQLASYRAELVSMGIPRSSFSEVKRRAKLEADQRTAHDYGVQVFSEAIGYKVDLFDGTEADPNDPRGEPREASSLITDEQRAAANEPPAPPAEAPWPDDKQVEDKVANVVAKASKRRSKAAEIADKYAPPADESRPLAGLADAIDDAEQKTIN